MKPSEYIADEVESLRALRREVLEPLDELRRELTMQGVEATAHPELSRLRRYEAAALRQFHKANAHLITTRDDEPTAAGRRAPRGTDRPIGELRRDWPNLDDLDFFDDDPLDDPPVAATAHRVERAPSPDARPAPAPASAPVPAAPTAPSPTREPSTAPPRPVVSATSCGFLAASPRPATARPLPTADTPPAGPTRANPIVVPPAVVDAVARPLTPEPPRLNRRQRRAASRASRGRG